jgi:hypothetical protein
MLSWAPEAVTPDTDWPLRVMSCEEARVISSEYLMLAEEVWSGSSTLPLLMLQLTTSNVATVGVTIGSSPPPISSSSSPPHDENKAMLLNRNNPEKAMVVALW